MELGLSPSLPDNDEKLSLIALQVLPHLANEEMRAVFAKMGMNIKYSERGEKDIFIGHPHICAAGANQTLCGIATVTEDLGAALCSSWIDWSDPATVASSYKFSSHVECTLCKILHRVWVSRRYLVNLLKASIALLIVGVMGVLIGRVRAVGLFHSSHLILIRDAMGMGYLLLLSIILVSGYKAVFWIFVLILSNLPFLFSHSGMINWYTITSGVLLILFLIRSWVQFGLRERNRRIELIRQIKMDRELEIEDID
jgi:hypothetical protein